MDPVTSVENLYKFISFRARVASGSEYGVT